MKRTWRCLVGWLLVGLMVLQLPMTALADEIVPVEVEEAAFTFRGRDRADR